MPTARDLIGEHIDIELEMELCDEEEFAEKNQALQVLRQEIKRKTDNIDRFMVEISRREHLIDAEIESTKIEIERLRNRRSAMLKTKDYFNKVLLPIIINEVGDDRGVFETDTARYKLYETYGPVEIDEKSVSSKYMVTQILQKVDKKKARADAIAHKKEGKALPEGIKIYKVPRVRRS